MRRTLLVFMALLAAGTCHADGVFFGSLSAKQKELYRSYAQSRLGQELTEAQLQAEWKKLDSAEATTYAAITHALENTRLGSGTALDQVARVTSIHGDLPKNAEAFNLAVEWAPGAKRHFERSGFTYRIGLSHAGETGLSYLSQAVGLHLLFAKDGSDRGHVHVDYRGFGLGHFEHYGADIRAIGPECDLFGRPIDSYAMHAYWYGPIDGYFRGVN